jgi:iron-sulfur cluster assembly accessory protein
MAIDITDNAKSRIKIICEQYPNKVVRFSIESGGCHGFNKVWNIDDNINTDDTIFEFDKAKLVIDSISLEIINDAIIDYKSNFDGSIFTVDIPTATAKCGCGTSFSI